MPQIKAGPVLISDGFSFASGTPIELREVHFVGVAGRKSLEIIINQEWP